MAKRKTSRMAANPLPSLLRASAWDAGNQSMRAAGRTKWSRADFNAAAETQERLVRACYGFATDAPDSPLCYIRFGIAEQAERQGFFDLDTDMPSFYAAIEQAMNSQAEAA